MIWCNCLLAAVLAAATTTAEGQAPKPAERAPQIGTAVDVYRLRNVAAADVVGEVKAFAARQSLAVALAAEPVSNVVTVTGSQEARHRVAQLLIALDRAPRMVLTRMTVMRIPAGFLEEIGLADKDESKWVLTPREARMLSAALHRNDEAAVVCIPEFVTVENSTGSFHTGIDVGEFSASINSRLSPDGAAVQVRLETTFTLPSSDRPQGRDIQASKATDTVPVGSTWVVRGPCQKTAGDRAVEVIMLTTFVPVQPSDGK